MSKQLVNFPSAHEGPKCTIGICTLSPLAGSGCLCWSQLRYSTTVPQDQAARKELNEKKLGRPPHSAWELLKPSSLASAMLKAHLHLTMYPSILTCWVGFLAWPQPFLITTETCLMGTRLLTDPGNQICSVLLAWVLWDYALHWRGPLFLAFTFSKTTFSRCSLTAKKNSLPQLSLHF